MSLSSNGDLWSNGCHWLLDLSACACDAQLLADAPLLQARCLAACKAAGLRVVGDCFHPSPPAGVTGAVLLAQAHVVVHTWPEQEFVALDVYVGDDSPVHAAKGQALVTALRALFAPRMLDQRRVVRAHAHGLDVPATGASSQGCSDSVVAHA